MNARRPRAEAQKSEPLMEKNEYIYGLPPSSSSILGATFVGTNFLIARTGGDFNVPFKEAAWRDR